jgi:hypothetical protein
MYPDDYPATTDIYFRQWRDGFPQRIEFKIERDTPSGTGDAPPLQWDTISEATHRSRFPSWEWLCRCAAAPDIDTRTMGCFVTAFLAMTF